MPKPGYVYVATDKWKDGFCKVGKTIDLRRREKELNGGLLNGSIKIISSAWVDDADRVEKAFHKILDKFDEDQEWFNIEAKFVLPMVECFDKPAEPPIPVEDDQPHGVRRAGWWHEDGWQMHCSGKTQAEIAAKFGVSQGAVVGMKRKMRSAGRGKEEQNRLRRSVPKQVGKKEKLRSGRTPQAAFGEAIVEVLKKLGGSGPAKDVIERVGRRMQSQLRPADGEKLNDGQIVWVKDVHWARQALKSKGILKSNSPRGWWELA